MGGRSWTQWCACRSPAIMQCVVSLSGPTVPDNRLLGLQRHHTLHGRWRPRPAQWHPRHGRCFCWARGGVRVCVGGGPCCRDLAVMQRLVGAAGCTQASPVRTPGAACRRPWLEGHCTQHGCSWGWLGPGRCLRMPRGRCPALLCLPGGSLARGSRGRPLGCVTAGSWSPTAAACKAHRRGARLSWLGPAPATRSILEQGDGKMSKQFLRPRGNRTAWTFCHHPDPGWGWRRAGPAMVPPPHHRRLCSPGPLAVCT